MVTFGGIEKCAGYEFAFILGNSPFVTAGAAVTVLAEAVVTSHGQASVSVDPISAFP